MNTAYVYDGSLEGLLSAVFESYRRRKLPADIAPEGLFQPRLGQQVVAVRTDAALARRVRAGIVSACGVRAFDAVVAVSLSDDPAKGRTVLDFVRYAMKRGPRALDDAAHESVAAFRALDRAVCNERHRWQQFMRFGQVEGGVYFARCNPSANVVPLLMGWFAARFNTQPFVVYDEVHRIAGVSRDGSWALVATEDIDVPSETLEERAMKRAWKTFYDAVAVEARYNPDLRRQFMPKRLWRNVAEMREVFSRPEGAMQNQTAPASDACEPACGRMSDAAGGATSGSPCSSAPRPPISCG